MWGAGLCAQHHSVRKPQLVAGIGDRNGVPFRFITYSLYAFPMMVVSIAICHVYVWWRYF
jgi:hypothetical protein